MAPVQIGHASERDLPAECIDNCFAVAQACAGAGEECEHHEVDHWEFCAEVLPDFVETRRETASEA